MKRIDPADANLPDEQLRLKYPVEMETLRDVEWRLGLLRKGVPGLVSWEQTNDRKKLRKWIRRLATRLADARITGDTTESAKIEAELQRVVDKERLLALEDYEYRLREWQETTGGGRRRASRTPEERFMATGGRPGRRPGDTCTNTAPHRPSWLVDLDVQDKRDRRMQRPLKPIRDKYAERLQLQAKWSDQKAATRVAHKREALESKIRALLDWVWGEGRLMHVAEAVSTPEGDWLYIDDAHGIPYQTQRAAALAACAVRLTTGWAFPPETARGRVQ